jgi:hypothetical protein
VFGHRRNIRRIAANRVETASLISFKGQTEPIFTEQQNAVFSKDIIKSRVSYIALKSLAGLRPVVINLTEILSVSFFKKNTSLVIGMNHKNALFPSLPCNEFLKRAVAQLIEPNINSDMSPHLPDESDFVVLEQNLAIFFATGAALAAIMKNGIKRFGTWIYFRHLLCSIKMTRKRGPDGC